MTNETRTMVELTDVTGVELECPKCQAKMLYPMSKEVTRLITKCPNCYEPWFTLPGGAQFDRTIADQVTDWINGIYNLRDRPDVLARVRLHINDRL